MGTVLGKTRGWFWVCQNDLENCRSRERFRKLGVGEFKA